MGVLFSTTTRNRTVARTAIEPTTVTDLLSSSAGKPIPT
jgi:hypothetical protein